MYKMQEMYQQTQELLVKIVGKYGQEALNQKLKNKTCNKLK